MIINVQMNALKICHTKKTNSAKKNVVMNIFFSKTNVIDNVHSHIGLIIILKCVLKIVQEFIFFQKNYVFNSVHHLNLLELNQNVMKNVHKIILHSLLKEKKYTVLKNVLKIHINHHRINVLKNVHKIYLNIKRLKAVYLHVLILMMKIEFVR